MSGDAPETLIHVYDARAFALEADIQLPVRAEVRPQAFLDLPEKGGYLFQHTDAYRVEGVFSYRTAYTQVAGNRDLKDGHPYVTLATAVLEDFNVLDVVTADRVVAQASTKHRAPGSVPEVTFLGTRFDNLRIAGHPVDVHLDLDFFSCKPGDEDPWSGRKDFRDRVNAQYEAIRRESNLPDGVAERYNRFPSNSGSQVAVECSLVQRAEGSYPGRTFGHVIDVPHFGRVYLATVRLIETPEPRGTISTLFRLTMIEVKMGCIAYGGGSAGNTITNGGTKGSG